RPHAGVAVDRPRLFFPRVVPELAGTRNGVERPQQLAAPHVPRAHEALGVVVGLDGQAFAERRADEHHVPGDGRRRVQADLAGLEVDLLALADDGADFHVDDAVLAEGLDGLTGLGVQRDQAVAGRHEQDAVVALAVGPVRQAATGELPRRRDGARAL